MKPSTIVSISADSPLRLLIWPKTPASCALILAVFEAECKLCLTLPNNKGNYLARIQGKRHQTNLVKRAACEAKEAPAQPIWESSQSGGRLLDSDDEVLAFLRNCLDVLEEMAELF